MNAGRPRTVRRALAVAALVAFALVSLGGAGHAEDRGAQLERLRAAIQESRTRVASYEREQRGLLEALEAIDRSLVLLRREVDDARDAAERARRELTLLEAETADLTQKLQQTKRAMSARAVALYKAGELGVVRLLFSSGGVRDFFSRVSALRLLVGHDAELLLRHRTQVEALASAEARARQAASKRDAALARLADRSKELAAERRTKKQVVAQLYSDRRRERHALVELETAARALEETLASLRDAPAGAGAADLAGLRRGLPAPVDGRVVEGFGRVVDTDFRTATLHKGLSFEARRGAPVRSVAPASVRFAGWFRGYGRIVILDHGDAFFTVSGHLDEIAVSVGDRVAAGDVIGDVGDSGSLSGPRLYFEVRRGGEAVDPRKWLGRLD